MRPISTIEDKLSKTVVALVRFRKLVYKVYNIFNICFILFLHLIMITSLH